MRTNTQHPSKQKPKTQQQYKQTKTAKIKQTVQNKHQNKTNINITIRPKHQTHKTHTKFKIQHKPTKTNKHDM